MNGGPQRDDAELNGRRKWMQEPAGVNDTPKTCTKGIILAGGAGTRLFPTTKVINKHLLPVYDKPMIYYSLSTLMLAGIRDILVISAAETLGQFETLLRDGSRWGLSIGYAAQTSPRGIAEAFIIGEAFIGGDPVSLILGDNIFFGHGLPVMLREGAAKAASGACIFSYQVSEPERYGIISLEKDGSPSEIVEKPQHPKSNFAVTGLYFYDGRVVDIAKSLAPSGRGELEITDLNRVYLEAGRLAVLHFGRGFVWFDTGTLDSLSRASNYVELVQSRQNTGIAFPEEVAYRMGYVTIDQLDALTADMEDSAYKRYLVTLASELRTNPFY